MPRNIQGMSRDFELEVEHGGMRYLVEAACVIDYEWGGRDGPSGFELVEAESTVRITDDDESVVTDEEIIHLALQGVRDHVEQNAENWACDELDRLRDEADESGHW